MCEKINQVNSWLGSVFGDQPVPQFEVNTRTVDVLYQLARSSEARCSDTALLTEDVRQKAFMPAMNNLTNELLEAEKSNRRLERELKALRKRLGATLVLRSTLQEDINRTVKAQAAEGAKAEERLLNMDFVTAKAKELSNRRERAEAQLVSRNMDKSVTHQAVVQLSEEVTTLRQEIIPLKKKLEPYMDLSPAALDSQFEMKVDFK
ncbi:hypothetical protein F2P81_009152 [Scophthalmus maximus]|uniref:HAUS augmin-like complex subunit 1 n=1 Tax=Scophthalmus maximus TaxID=52904 RepID=A0A6A4T2V7_SCOMX|nr:hypothetical protein F2P81_009152 [Scophthalmus maximus]